MGIHLAENEGKLPASTGGQPGRAALAWGRRAPPPARGCQAVSSWRKAGREEGEAAGRAGLSAGRAGSGERPVQRRGENPSGHGPGSARLCAGRQKPRHRAHPALPAPRARPGTRRGLRDLRHRLPARGTVSATRARRAPVVFFSRAVCRAEGREKVVRFAQVARGGLCATVD